LDNIKNKNISFKEPNLEKYIDNYIDKLHLSSDIKYGINTSDIIVITIGTSIKNGMPLMDNLWNLIDEILNCSIKNKLFIFKTTLPLNTIEKIKNIFEENTDLTADKDFYISFCPERVVEGKIIEELKSLPKVIGGIGPISTELTKNFIKPLGGKIIIVKNPQTAEFIKLMDNSFRITLFGFSNDLTYISSKNDIDIYEAIDAANENYSRNNIPYPSCGVGGYCLTKDPYYLEQSFHDYGIERGFFSTWFYARESCNHKIEYITKIISNTLESKNIPIKQANVLICGITYKENIDDTRDSHGLLYAKNLFKEGAKIQIWDPYANKENIDYKIIREKERAFIDQDLAFFTVKHDTFLELRKKDNFEKILKLMRNKIIIDGWGIFNDYKFNKDIEYIQV